MYSLLLFICNQKYHRRISPQKKGCQTFNGDVKVSLKEHLDLCLDFSYVIHLKFQNGDICYKWSQIITLFKWKIMSIKCKKKREN